MNPIPVGNEAERYWPGSRMGNRRHDFLGWGCLSPLWAAVCGELWIRGTSSSSPEWKCTTLLQSPVSEWIEY